MLVTRGGFEWLDQLFRDGNLVLNAAWRWRRVGIHFRLSRSDQIHNHAEEDQDQADVWSL